MGKTVAGALFFILGAFFGLLLVMSVAMLLAGMVPAEPVAAERKRGPASAAPRQSAKPQAYPRLTDNSRGKDTRQSDSDRRDSYRNLAQLARCETALTRIAASGEPPAAKIAEQTLRRLRNGAEPAQARLAFALSRLELLSLRPETKARRAACDLLASLA